MFLQKYTLQRQKLGNNDYFHKSDASLLFLDDS